MTLNLKNISVLGILMSAVLLLNTVWPQPVMREELNLLNQSKQKRKVQLLQQKFMHGSWINHNFQLDLMLNGQYELTQKNMNSPVKFNQSSNDGQYKKQQGYWWIDFNFTLKQAPQICLSYLLTFQCYSFKQVRVSSSHLDKLELTAHNKTFVINRFSK